MMCLFKKLLKGSEVERNAGRMGLVWLCHRELRVTWIPSVCVHEEPSIMGSHSPDPTEKPWEPLPKWMRRAPRFYAERGVFC